MKLGSLVKQTGRSIYKFGSKNSHIISGVAAIGGVVLTAVLTYKARPKADAIIEEQKGKLEELEEVVNIPDEEMKRCKREITTETVKRLIPVLGPAIISGIGTCGCIGFSVFSSEKKIVSATSIAAISETAYKELYDKTKEIVGEEKAEEIKQQATQEIADKKYKDLDDDDIGIYILHADGGNDLFYDPNTGRLFTSDVDTIMNACDTLTRKINRGTEAYIDYNEFYSEIGLPQTTFGAHFGWGGTSPTRELTPNMNPTVKVGKKSAIVLDWYDRPSSTFRTELRDFIY